MEIYKTNCYYCTLPIIISDDPLTTSVSYLDPKPKDFCNMICFRKYLKLKVTTTSINDLYPHVIGGIMKPDLEHIKKDCTDKYCSGCALCNLFLCSICGLAEGELTTHCPGKPSAVEWGDKVYKENWNYKYGHWYKRSVIKLREG